MQRIHYSYAYAPSQARWHIYSYGGQGMSPTALCGYRGATEYPQPEPPVHPFTNVCVVCRDAAPPELQEAWDRPSLS